MTMLRIVIFSLIFFNICFTAINTETSCSLHLSNDIPKNEPVYLLQKSNGQLELYEPTGESNAISSQEKMLLFCPGRRNTLANSNTNINELPCKSANRFRNDLHELNCTKQVTGDLQTTSKQCNLNKKKGLVYQAGFLVEQNFVKLYEICYDSANAAVIYTYHQINGNAIKHSIKESRRTNFKTIGVPSRAKVDINYRKQSQIEHFNKILGRHQRYFSNSTFLSRGHLAPDADFIFSSAQFATYFYANVCPQFQTINGGNWVSVESITRQLANEAQTHLNIYTGVHEQLALPSASGDLIDLYLSDTNQIEVPKYIWKIVHNPQKQSAIVFITLNNPYATRNEVRDFCTNICEEAGITTKKFREIKKGYTNCCAFDEFSRTISPININVRSLLKLK